MQLWSIGADVSATTVISESAHDFSRNVTTREVLLNCPYADQLCIVKLTGKELKETIEYLAGFLERDKNGKIKSIDRQITPKPMFCHFDPFYPVKYEAGLSRLVGHRLTKVTLSGGDLEDNKVYKLAASNYRALGGGFHPACSVDKIEKISDQGYVRMFGEYPTHDGIKVNTVKDYKSY